MKAKQKQKPSREYQLLCAVVQHLSWGGMSAEEITALVVTKPPLTAAKIAAIVEGPDYRRDYG